MGRTLRFYYPGSAVHIVARTQGHEPWFKDEIKDRIADILLTGVTSAGARVAAFTVMDNHFHVLAFQGRATLGEIMQPPMRRIALLIQKTQCRTGHVFERRFRAKLCSDAEHLPNALLYIHRNPVVARKCESAHDYRWSSAAAYEGACPPGFISVADGLKVFDTTGALSDDALKEVYRAKLQSQTAEDFDGYWAWLTRSLRQRKKTDAGYVPLSPHRNRHPLRDLRDVAVETLKSIDDGVDIELVRSRYGNRAVVRVRVQLIAALSQRGYAGVDIAGYLRISQATVSRIRAAMRWAKLPDHMKRGTN